MKGKISTKAIIIAIVTIVLLAVATTGTILFLKDSGEAAAAEEQNTLPVAGTDNEAGTSTEQTVENEGTNSETTEEAETSGTVGQNSNQVEGAITTTETQNSDTIGEEPAPTTVEQERVVSEETTLGWNSIALLGNEADYTKKDINYNNLKYTVNYYEDGDLVYTDIIKGNKLGYEVTEVENRMKEEYYLDEENTTKLPFIVTKNESENVIDIHYLIKKYNITFVADENGTLEGTTEFIVPSGSEFGSKVNLPQPVGNEGYCFYKWEEEIPASDSKVIADATYRAIFAIDKNENGTPDEDEEKYDIIYVAEGATNVPEGETEVLPLVEKTVSQMVPEKVGYVFTEWTTDDVEVIEGKFIMPENDVTFTAVFEEDANGNGTPDEDEEKYDIIYVAEGATNVPEGETEVLPLVEKTVSQMVPEKVGYVFTEWTTDDVEVTEGKFIMPEKDVTFTAIFEEDANGNGIPDEDEEKYDIIYVAEGATNVPEGETEVLPLVEKTVSQMVPEKAGWVFTEWTTDDVEVTEGKFIMPEKDVTFTAVFKEDKNDNDIPDDDDTYHTIMFIADENGSLNGQTRFRVLTGLTFGESVIVPEPVANEGYSFDKWETLLPAAGSKVESDAIYRAKFVAKQYEYTVTYWYNGEVGFTEKDTKPYGEIVRKDDLKIEEHKMYNGKIYGYKEIKTAQNSESIIINVNTELNVINVYYVRAEIKAEKTSTIKTTAEQGKAHKGDEITYTIKVWNAGKAPKEVTITDSIPQVTNLIASSDTKTAGTTKVENGKITWIVNVKENTSYEDAETLTFKVKVNNDVTGIIKNIAEMDSTNIEDKNQYEIVEPIINVVKSSDSSGQILEYGDEITYKIVATNTGTGKGTVKITDSDLRGLIDDGKVTVNIEYKDLANELISGKNVEVLAGGKSEIIFKVTVIANAGTEIKNTIEVEGGTNNEQQEVKSTVEKNIEIQKLSKTILGKNIVIAMDRSESMRGEDLAKEKQAVCEFIDSIYPNQNTNNGSKITVIAYSSAIHTYTVGTAASYTEAQNLKNEVNGVSSWGITDIKFALNKIDGYLKNSAYQNKEDNIVIFVGDGNPNALFTAVNKYFIGEELEPIEDKAIMHVVAIEAKGDAKERLEFIARNGHYYNSSYEGTALKDTLSEITVKINKLPKTTKTSSEGKLELENLYTISADYPVTINGTLYTSKPSNISENNGKYYLDIRGFESSEDVSITYYIQ